MADIVFGVAVGAWAILTILSSLLLITSVFLLLECLFALGGRCSIPLATIPTTLTLAVMVPAHNEATGIELTLTSLQSQLRPQDRLLVIADNCTDDTAAVARRAGATVIERQNLAQRGKGYALDFGLQYLASSPPDVVILVDADCTVHPGSLAALTTQAAQTQRPVQATYLMDKPLQPQLKDAISAFAFKVKNLVRPLGLWQLGQPCLLTGTGIALPWRAATAVSIASGHIVEDMKLGLDLALVGYPPGFCQAAYVTSRLPSLAAAATSQRTRWEHGHLQMFLDYGPKLFVQALAQGRLDLLALGLELTVLPISLQVAVTVALAGLAGLVGLAGWGWLPFYLTTAAGFCLGTAIGAAWWGYGRSDLALQELSMVPIYVLNKLPLYFKFLVKPEKNWVRTERDS
ncbi:MAG: glycosyltransferase family 2 protein [Nodosilinea sp.]